MSLKSEPCLYVQILSIVISVNGRQRPRTLLLLTFGAVVWKLMSVTGTGADDSMEMITTSTSGREGGESRAK